MPDDLTEIAKQTLDPISDIVKRIAGPLADEIGESLAVLAKPYRIMLSVKMFQKAQRMLKQAGVTPNAVPPRLFLPILEAASIQDNEELHSRWAALLANASLQADAVHPSFIEVLRQLAPDDAALLDKLYDSCMEKRSRRVKPWVDQISYAEREERRASGEDPEPSFENLIRLGLIATKYEFDGSAIEVQHSSNLRHFRAKAGRALTDDDYLTEFAIRFVHACRAPKTMNAR
jgi:hypothetical protein